MKVRGLLLSVLVAATVGNVYAEECNLTVHATDAMQFDAKSIDVPASCKDFTINLIHSGKLPKNVMGHNWVLTKNADVQPVASEGMVAGLANNYLKAGDERVIASTIIIGGGEQASVTFPVSKLNASEAYTFFCSFPGHSAIMKGILAVK